MGTIEDIIKKIEGLDKTSQSMRQKKQKEKLFSELREEISKLKQFEIWKEWKNR